MDAVPRKGLFQKEEQTLPASWPSFEHVNFQHQRQIQQETSSEDLFILTQLFTVFGTMTYLLPINWMNEKWLIGVSESTMSPAQFSHYFH